MYMWGRYEWKLCPRLLRLLLSCSVAHWAPGPPFDARLNAGPSMQIPIRPCPAHPMQYAAQNKSTLSTPRSYIQRKIMRPQTENALCGSYRSMMVRKRRHKIDTLRSMSVTTRPRSRRKRTIHAHASCATISSSGRAMALPIRIEIFSAPASIPIRRIVPAPIALRRGIRVRRIRVRVPGRRARSGGRGLRAGERDVVPHSTAGPIYRAGAALRRGFRLASAGARSR